MAEIGGALLSAFLQVVIDRAASREVIDFLRRHKLIGGLVNKLKTVLMAVNVLVEDAEEKQATKPNVKTWLDELKDAVYDAEEILDKVATQALRRKLDAEFETTAIKVRNRTYASLSLYKLRGKIEEVHDRLKSLAEQKDLIGLREGVTERPSERSPTTSLMVEESGIFGRDANREEIIKGLLSEDTGGNEVGVIAIVGMGGMGKTTLAQQVYNDERVKKQFDLEAWVCVSEDFDLSKVTKTMLDEVIGSTTDTANLNQLQVKLREQLTGKCFLLILDDVWNKNLDDWEALSKPWKSGARGSKVIITTRDQSVASVTKASANYHLEKLTEEDCWSLFAKYAFENTKSSARPKLEEVGRQIAKKCEGLPLAAKAIGAMLRTKANVDEWEMILNSELWNLSIEETKILPALRVSYKYLPSHLKRCFAYCAIFPKDYDFTKDQLVLLWMAEGFLQDVGNKTMEEIGEDYFHDLVSRSLFQRSVDHDTHFVMHDLINDLAKFVSGQFSFRLNVDKSHEGFPKTRYLSYMRTRFDTFEKFKVVYEVKQLRTFLPLELAPEYNWFHLTKKVLRDLLPILRCLRVLSLSGYKNMTKLPDSVGKMEHLRYLDISFTKVMRLPESICQLCNLQTLKLSGCENLTALPRDMGRLINLRHLDITETGIKEMPMHLGNLKCLRTLPKFIVSKHGGSGSSLGELGKLANLRGALSIWELQNVESPQDALDANLKNKKYLQELALFWNDSEGEDADISGSQKIVLDNLRPHPNLDSLTINGYSGERFPDWVGHDSFSNIASLHLKKCKYCCSLPPLGQLHFLQNLSIEGFDGIVTAGSEFYGIGSSSIKPFGSLKVLKFKQMSNWETWFPFGAENEDVAFPSLEELYIQKRPKLKVGFSINLPSLAKLEIYECPQLVISLRRAPVIRELELMSCNEILLKELPVGMQRLRVRGFDSMESLPEGLLNSNSCLQDLEISDCSSLVSLPTGGLSSTLKELRIISCMKFELPTHLDYSFLQELVLRNCNSVKSLPEGLFDSNSCLQKLEISDCSSLVSLPTGGLSSTLKELQIISCMKFELPTHLGYSFLEELELSDCDSLRSFPLDLFPNLKSIYLRQCGNLESLTVPKQHEQDLMTLCIEIKSCPNFVSFPKGGLRAPNLTTLYIHDCKSLTSLPDKMHTFLPSLEDLLINGCPEMESFPEGGLPSNLRVIWTDCHKLVARRMGWGLQTLTSLRHVSIEGKSGMVVSFPETGLLPSNLTYLYLESFSNLESLDKEGLQHLTSLEYLSIRACPKLKCMPDRRLPASLNCLYICSCPLLKKQLQRRKGKEWRKVAHVPYILIDGEWIE